VLASASDAGFAAAGGCRPVALSAKRPGVSTGRLVVSTADALLAVTAGLAVVVLMGLYGALRRMRRRATVVDFSSQLWDRKDYRCPECGCSMTQGWALAGKGIIWRSRGQAAPGALAHIGQALKNTLSLAARPELNMAWRCEACRLVLVDHAKLVRVRGRLDRESEMQRKTGRLEGPRAR